MFLLIPVVLSTRSIPVLGIVHPRHSSGDSSLSCWEATQQNQNSIGFVYSYTYFILVLLLYIFLLMQDYIKAVRYSQSDWSKGVDSFSGITLTVMLTAFRITGLL